ncbi:MAG: ice-binding family protein [Bacteroidota bacterium]|jgi:hypothetical protein
MKINTKNPTTVLSWWTRFCSIGASAFGGLGLPLSAGLTLALLSVVLMGGCKEDEGGIVNVFNAPAVIRTSPLNNATNVPLNKTSGASRSAGVAAVKIITATFSAPMDPKSINTTSFTVLQGGASLSGTVSYSDTTAVFVAPNGLGPNLTYTCTITTGATDVGGNALASNYVWTFTTIAPGTPTLIAPVNAAVNISTSLTMIWNAVPGADTYRLQVSTSNLFATTVYNDSTRTGISQQISGLTVGMTYYWRVNAKIAGGTSAYSTAWSFTTIAPPAAPVLVAPIAAAQNQATTLTLSWNASTGANTYRLQVSTSNLFATTVYNDSTITGTSHQITGLAVGATYYWRVNAKNAAGTSAYSTRSFKTTTIVGSLQPPTLAAPADSSVNISTSPTLSWNASTGAATYRLQVDTSAVFAHTVFDDSTLTGLSQPISGLTVGKTYYWHVNAKNSSGTSAYSTIWRFTVGASPPPPVNLLGSASTYGIMATSAITNTGNSIINGDVSLDPGTSMTGFPPGVVNGTIHINDTVSAKARADLLAAYNTLKGLPPGTTISAGADLGALYPTGIPPGTYTSGSTMMVSTPLVLDAGGDANAVWVFQIGSSLTTGASVSLANNAQAKNVFWVPTSDATVGVGTIFYGTIVAGRNVSGVTGAVINGRILAGAITAGTIALDGNTVNVPLP